MHVFNVYRPLWYKNHVSVLYCCQQRLHKSETNSQLWKLNLIKPVFANNVMKIILTIGTAACLSIIQFQFELVLLNACPPFLTQALKLNGGGG